MSPCSIDVGDRVLCKLSLDDELSPGILRFKGPVEFAAGNWMGVELIQSIGESNLDSERYFSCKPGCGRFLMPQDVEKDFRSELEAQNAPEAPELEESLTLEMPLQEGQLLLYHSISTGCWLNCRVVAARGDGCVQIDVRGEDWIPPEEQTAKLRMPTSAEEEEQTAAMSMFTTPGEEDDDEFDGAVQSFTEFPMSPLEAALLEQTAAVSMYMTPGEEDDGTSSREFLRSFAATSSYDGTSSRDLIRMLRGEQQLCAEGLPEEQTATMSMFATPGEEDDDEAAGKPKSFDFSASEAAGKPTSLDFSASEDQVGKEPSQGIEKAPKGLTIAENPAESEEDLELPQQLDSPSSWAPDQRFSYSFNLPSFREGGCRERGSYTFDLPLSSRSASDYGEPANLHQERSSVQHLLEQNHLLTEQIEDMGCKYDASQEEIAALKIERQALKAKAAQADQTCTHASLMLERELDLSASLRRKVSDLQHEVQLAQNSLDGQHRQRCGSDVSGALPSIDEQDAMASLESVGFTGLQSHLPLRLGGKHSKSMPKFFDISQESPPRSLGSSCGEGSLPVTASAPALGRLTRSSTSSIASSWGLELRQVSCSRQVKSVEAFLRDVPLNPPVCRYSLGLPPALPGALHKPFDPVASGDFDELASEENDTFPGSMSRGMSLAQSMRGVFDRSIGVRSQAVRGRYGGRTVQKRWRPQLPRLWSHEAIEGRSP